MTLAGARSNREALIDTDGCGPTAPSEKLRRSSSSATGPSMYFQFLQLRKEIAGPGPPNIDQAHAELFDWVRPRRRTTTVSCTAEHTIS
jgi:hypothetical protein